MGLCYSLNQLVRSLMSTLYNVSCLSCHQVLSILIPFSSLSLPAFPVSHADVGFLRIVILLCRLGFYEGVLIISVGEESACNAGDVGVTPGWGRSPGGGHGNPLQYSCLENPMDRGAWRATVQRVTKSRMRLRDCTAAAEKPRSL